MKLAEAENLVGEEVLYLAPFEGREGDGEYGIVTGTTETFVLVRFGRDGLEQAVPAARLTVLTR